MFEDSLRFVARAAAPDRVGTEHRGVGMQKGTTAQDVVLVPADSRLAAASSRRNSTSSRRMP
jgi:hypothetical protein